jgi:hypothetical protein
MNRFLKCIIHRILGRKPIGLANRIRVSGRDTYDYIVDGRKATIYVELLMGKIERRICLDSINKWNPPHDDEEMTQADRNVIFQSLCEYFEWHQIPYDTLE